MCKRQREDVRLGGGLAQARRAHLFLHETLLVIAVPERVGVELLHPKLSKGPCLCADPCSSGE